MTQHPHSRTSPAYEIVLPLDSPTTEETGTKREKWWQDIARFSEWPAWLPAAKLIELTTSGEPGRGTGFNIILQGALEHWRVSYWSPGYRAVFQISAPGYRGALALELLDADSPMLQLRLTADISYRGWRRGFTPLLRRRFQHRLSQFAVALQTQLLQS